MGTRGLIIGTCHFVSAAAAIRYYGSQGFSDPVEAVFCKLRDGEIKIGPPTAKPGDLIVTVDGGARYSVIEQGD